VKLIIFVRVLGRYEGPGTDYEGAGRALPRNCGASKAELEACRDGEMKNRSVVGTL